MCARETYDQVGTTFREDADAAVTAARALADRLTTWPAQEHVDLLPK